MLGGPWTIFERADGAWGGPALEVLGHFRIISGKLPNEFVVQGHCKSCAELFFRFDMPLEGPQKQPR